MELQWVATVLSTCIPPRHATILETLGRRIAIFLRWMSSSVALGLAQLAFRSGGRLPSSAWPNRYRHYCMRHTLTVYPPDS